MTGERPLRVLDLFAGLGGWSSAFKARGHEIVTVDIDPRFACTITADVFSLRPRDLRGPWDVVLASPPCEAFSVASIGHHWRLGPRGPEPQTDHARLSMRLVDHTLALLRGLKPRSWVLENPRGMLRKLPMMQRAPGHVAVWYCRYGDERAKPTDLWYDGLPWWRPSRPCAYKRAGAPPNDCSHEASPRGGHTGTQGRQGAAARAVVPFALSLEVCIAVENEVYGPPRSPRRSNSPTRSGTQKAAES